MRKASSDLRQSIAVSFMSAGIIYPPVTHWAWTEDGWLNKLGYVDFSGSGPIHLLGGVCSFVAAVSLGPRLGRFGASKEEIVGHSVPVRQQRPVEYLCRYRKYHNTDSNKDNVFSNNPH
jgi:ammonia channel protein AmtB